MRHFAFDGKNRIQSTMISAISSAFLTITYGIQTQGSNDPYFQIGQEMTQSIIAQVGLGVHLVDYLPARTCISSPTGGNVLNNVQ